MASSLAASALPVPRAPRAVRQAPPARLVLPLAHLTPLQALPTPRTLGCTTAPGLPAARRRSEHGAVRVLPLAAAATGEKAGSSDPSDAPEAGDQGPATVFIKRTLRGGQNETHEGTVIVCGDVNPGSMVSAGGDVIIWGRLRGEAHAGKNGDRSATIMALDMEPTQLRIADKIAFGPEGGGSEHPEVAQLGGDGTINVMAAGPMATMTAEERAAKRARLTASGSATLSWTAAAKVARFTGAYITLIGLACMVAPAKMFGLLFDLRMVSTGWVRVMGVLAAAFGINYLMTAYGDSMGAGARSFYVSTVASRVFIFLSFGALVACRCVQPELLLLGLMNAGGAAAMVNALNSSPAR